jgi:hypothetical protein
LRDGLFKNLKHALGVIFPGEAPGILLGADGDPVSEFRIGTEAVECSGDRRRIARVDEDGIVSGDTGLPNDWASTIGNPKPS